MVEQEASVSPPPPLLILRMSIWQQKLSPINHSIIFRLGYIRWALPLLLCCLPPIQVFNLCFESLKLSTYSLINRPAVAQEAQEVIYGSFGRNPSCRCDQIISPESSVSDGNGNYRDSCHPPHTIYLVQNSG